MTVQNSTAVRNAQADAWETAIGVSAKVQLYTGAPPANCAAAATGTKLIEWTLASDWAPAASGGTKTLSATPIVGTGLAPGSAGYYRIVDNAGTTCHEQGTVTATGGGGDATIDNVVIAVSQVVNIDSWSKTIAGA